MTRISSHNTSQGTGGAQPESAVTTNQETTEVTKEQNTPEQTVHARDGQSAQTIQSMQSAQVAAEVRDLLNEPAPAATTPTSGQAMEENIVSKHPDATIPESDISLADIGRKRSHPIRTACYVVLVLAALILPYWGGRVVGVRQTSWIIEHFGNLDPRGIALVTWSVTLFTFVSIIMLIVDRVKSFWFALFVLFLCAEQFAAGVGMLRFDFWHATYVIYGDSARLVNAADLGIIAAALALATFAVVWVGLLIAIKKESPLNVLTHVWTSLILLFGIELIALSIVLFGGLLTVV